MVGNALHHDGRRRDCPAMVKRDAAELELAARRYESGAEVSEPEPKIAGSTGAP
jgi:hypothetical protein